MIYEESWSNQVKRIHHNDPHSSYSIDLANYYCLFKSVVAALYLASAVDNYHLFQEQASIQSEGGQQ